ncbi:hypothetical protein J4Q44_G00374180 [Coregonus suidteri]|uniref:Uncharacterized protein n=1 Tax=Coregonus suidteri TaxID=861788 RepID=A0AAN8Q4Q8_9TELE
MSSRPPRPPPTEAVKDCSSVRWMLSLLKCQNDSGDHNSQLVEALCALDPERHDFLDVKKGETTAGSKKVKPLLGLRR